MADSKDIVNLTESKSVDLSHLDEESKKEIHQLIAKQKVVEMRGFISNGNTSLFLLTIN